MNKAFIREPDQATQLNCPKCGSMGVEVQEATLRGQLSEDAQRRIAKSAFFCPFPTCEVAYFDTFDRLITVEEVPHAVWPKDPSAPICGCFGFTTDEIEADIAEGSVARTKAQIARANSEEAKCQSMAADGRSCVGEIQRYYMRRKAEG